MSLYTKHLITSFVLLFVLVGALFLSSNFIRNFLANPGQYVAINLPTSNLQFFIMFFALAVIAVLISYIFYLLLTFHSRTELQVWNATKSLALSKEQFKKLYDNAPMPYIMLGKNAEIHEPNKAALRFFEVLPEEIDNKNFFSYLSDEYKNQAEIFFEYYKTGVSIDRKEVDFITKSGAIKSVLLSIFEMKNLASSSGDRGIAMIFDITEQKRLDKAKTEFVSLASHQLRTPLATTKWYTEMLISGELGDLNSKQKEYVEKLNTVNKDMIDLAEELLNVSRIEMGSLPIKLQATNVKDLTESILIELFPQVQKNQITIKRQYNNLFENVNTDPKLLRIVIQNIISNAIKYTLAGGTVSIIFDESNRQKKIIVADTGIGIPQGEQGRIFSKLFRADNAKKLGTSQGTGLGLYLIKSMIESLGGGISFVSEEGKGSVFTLKF